MAPKMTKKELIADIAEDQGCTQQEVSATVDALFEKILQAIESGQDVAIHGFGTFARKERPARQGRNPQTGAPVDIPASTGLGFKPAQAVKNRLNP